MNFAPSEQDYAEYFSGENSLYYRNIYLKKQQE